MKNIYVLGGAGYLGIFLVHKLSEIYPNQNITVVTQNTTKEIFFRLHNVKVIANTSTVSGEEITLINLAYSLGDFYKDTTIKNLKILQQIGDLARNNKLKKIIHVSTIVMSKDEKQLKLPDVNKNDIYYFAKSYFENKLSKLSKKHNIPTVILRSGNILGPGSPWIARIIDRLVNEQPLIGNRINYPSRTTFVGNLVYAIIKLAEIESENKVTIMNFCEFGDVSWKTWIDRINTHIQYKVKNWGLDSVDDAKPNLKDDLYNIKTNIKNQLVLLLVKGRYTSNVIIRIVDFLRLNKLKSETKTTVRLQTNNKAKYIDLSEYNVVKVFLNNYNHKLENVPKQIVDTLPYNFENSLQLITDWIELSGYNKLI